MQSVCMKQKMLTTPHSKHKLQSYQKSTLQQYYYRGHTSATHWPTGQDWTLLIQGTYKCYTLTSKAGLDPVSTRDIQVLQADLQGRTGPYYYRGYTSATSWPTGQDRTLLLQGIYKCYKLTYRAGQDPIITGDIQVLQADLQGRTGPYYYRGYTSATSWPTGQDRTLLLQGIYKCYKLTYRAGQDPIITGDIQVLQADLQGRTGPYYYRGYTSATSWPTGQDRTLLLQGIYKCYKPTYRAGQDPIITGDIQVL